MKQILVMLIFILSVKTTTAQTVESVKEPGLLQLIIDYGKTYIGTPYAYGGCSAVGGFDCSGFVSYVFKMGGQILPRSSSTISTMGSAVSLKDIKKGDLLFFKTSSKGTISHVGIVSEVDENKIIMLHSSTTYGVQEVDILKSNYWSTRLVMAKAL